MRAGGALSLPARRPVTRVPIATFPMKVSLVAPFSGLPQTTGSANGQ